MLPQSELTKLPEGACVSNVSAPSWRIHQLLAARAIFTTPPPSTDRCRMGTKKPLPGRNGTDKTDRSVIAGSLTGRLWTRSDDAVPRHRSPRAATSRVLRDGWPYVANASRGPERCDGRRVPKWQVCGAKNLHRYFPRKDLREIAWGIVAAIDRL